MKLLCVRSRLSTATSSGRGNTSHANELVHIIQYYRTMDRHLGVSEHGDGNQGSSAAKAHASEPVLHGQIARSDVQTHRRRQEISAGLEFVVSHDAELLKRLEDA